MEHKFKEGDKVKVPCEGGAGGLVVGVQDADEVKGYLVKMAGGQVWCQEDDLVTDG